jgi:NTP pyrophosphatase (non-canonical NTP hydrolase)
MTNGELIEQLRAFVAEREWQQFHTSENLAKSISIEAAELLELYQWDSEAEEARLKEELADVLTYCLLLADRHNFDVTEIVLEKLEQTKAKYPVEKAKGKSVKYDRL